MPARSVLIATLSAVALIGSLGWHRTKVQPIPVATLPVAAATSIALPTSSDQPRTRDGRQYPKVPNDSAELASLLAAVEEVMGVMAPTSIV